MDVNVSRRWNYLMHMLVVGSPLSPCLKRLVKALADYIL